VLLRLYILTIDRLWAFYFSLSDPTSYKRATDHACEGMRITTPEKATENIHITWEGDRKYLPEKATNIWPTSDQRWASDLGQNTYRTSSQSLANSPSRSLVDSLWLHPFIRRMKEGKHDQVDTPSCLRYVGEQNHTLSSKQTDSHLKGQSYLSTVIWVHQCHLIVTQCSYAYQILRPRIVVKVYGDPQTTTRPRPVVQKVYPDGHLL